MKFDFHNQPYIMAHVRGTIISVQPKGEQTDVKIKPQMFELMQNAKEKSPEVDYRNKEIVLEVMRPPEGLEQGKTLDAEVRVVHSADNVVRFLGVSVRVI